MVSIKTLSRAGVAAVLSALVLICVPRVAGASDTQTMAKTISVVIDQAHLVDLPAGTSTLIIGNPTIADVTMIGAKGSLMILTPKAFGETNFIALDSNGKPLTESIIRVVAGTDAMIVQRGMERQSYACAPKCQATEKLGDDAKYFAATVDQAKAYNSSASNVTPPTSASAR
ncbi:pilus assembly protein N-terminal domain-containing protein [Beijerinckia sp. L45]|uniref:pilus assembly protein N-terminal domain-containing protein n=1 Tax=Beijerinckia sp. L45 TaxID=1641855 RepID=UPI00131DBB45|nr:pilus assembly protein N-terminal domain-containing protein [Beijerinckia sp. L45]